MVNVVGETFAGCMFEIEDVIQSMRLVVTLRYYI